MNGPTYLGRELRSRGIGILEVVIATALLLLVVYGITQFVTGSRVQSEVIQGSSECQSDAQSLLQSISNIGVRSSVEGAYLLGAPKGPIPTQVPIEMAGYVTQWYFAPVIESGANPRIRNAQHIVSSANLAQAFLNSDPSTVCGAKRGMELPAGHKLLPRKSGLTNPKYFLRVLPVDLATNNDLDCPDQPVVAVPLGERSQALSDVASDGVAVFHDTSSPTTWSQIGYRVVISVLHDEGGVQRECNSQSLYQHQRDPIYDDSITMTPYVQGVPTSDLSPLTPLGSGLFLSCGPQAGYNNIQLDLKFPNLEPGSVVICRGLELNANGAVTATSPWFSCDQVRFNSQTGPTTATSPEIDRVVVKFQGLPGDKKYRLEFKGVDTAGNPSAKVGSVDFILDQTRPGIGNISWGPILGDPEDSPIMERAELPFPFKKNTPWSSVLNVPLQCKSGRVDFYAPYAGGPDDFPETWANCSCRYDGSPTTCTGRCALETPVTTTGSHNVEMVAADLCGSDPSKARSQGFHTQLAASFNPVKDVGVLPTFDDDNTPTGTAHHSFDVPALYSNPYYVVECDCTGFNGAPLTPGQRTCASRQPQGPDGCLATAKNFKFRYYDICGRSSRVKLGEDSYGQYAIRGDEGDTCTAIECGVTGNSVGEDNLLCCQYADSGICNQVGKCVKSNLDVQFPGLQCSNPTSGSFPTADYPYNLPDWRGGAPEPVCPSREVATCSYGSTCLGLPQASGQCSIGARQGDLCAYDVLGTCDSANNGTCNATTCPGNGLPCSGAAVGNCNSDDSPPVYNNCDGVNNTTGERSACCYKVTSACTAPDGGCSGFIGPLGAGPNNVNCPVRGPSCNGSPPPAPPVDVCTAPLHDTLSECLTAAGGNPAAYCEPNGACLELKTCDAGQFSSKQACEDTLSTSGNPPEVASKLCEPVGPKCWAIRDCGTKYSTDGYCRTLGNCTACAKDVNSCYSCTQNKRWVFKECLIDSTQRGTVLLPAGSCPLTTSSACTGGEPPGSGECTIEQYQSFGPYKKFVFECRDVVGTPPPTPADPPCSGAVCSWTPQSGTCQTCPAGSGRTGSCIERTYSCKMPDGSSAPDSCCLALGSKPGKDYVACNDGTWQEVFFDCSPANCNPANPDGCKKWEYVCVDRGTGQQIAESYCPAPKPQRPPEACTPPCVNAYRVDRKLRDWCTEGCLPNGHADFSCRRIETNPEREMNWTCCPGTSPRWERISSIPSSCALPSKKSNSSYAWLDILFEGVIPQAHALCHYTGQCESVTYDLWCE